MPWIIHKVQSECTWTQTPPRFVGGFRRYLVSGGGGEQTLSSVPCARMYACAWGVSRTDHMLVVYFEPLVTAKAHQTVIMSCLWGVRAQVSTMAGAIWDVPLSINRALGLGAPFCGWPVCTTTARSS